MIENKLKKQLHRRSISNEHFLNTKYNVSLPKINDKSSNVDYSQLADILSQKKQQLQNEYTNDQQNIVGSYYNNSQQLNQTKPILFYPKEFWNTVKQFQSFDKVISDYNQDVKKIIQIKRLSNTNQTEQQIKEQIAKNLDVNKTNVQQKPNPEQDQVAGQNGNENNNELNSINNNMLSRDEQGQSIIQDNSKKTSPEKSFNNISCHSNTNKYSVQLEQLQIQLWNNKNQKLYFEQSLQNIINKKLQFLCQDESINQKKEKKIKMKLKVYEKQDAITNIKDKNKESVDQSQAFLLSGSKEIPTLILHWYNIENNLYRPQVRLGATLTFFNNQAFLIGGLGAGIIGEVTVLQHHKWNWMPLKGIRQVLSETDGNNNFFNFNNLQSKINLGEKVTGNTQNQQHQQQQQLLYKNEQIPARYNHSACYYQKFIYIFGGELQYNDRSQRKQLTNQIISYNIENLTWKIIQCRGEMIDPRRNHSACIIGKYMLVVGGISQHEKYFSDLFLFEINTPKWFELKQQLPAIPANLQQIQPTPIYNNPFKQGIAYHACSAVVYSEFILHQKNKNPSPSASHIKEEGVYLFGGEFGSGTYNEKLYILKIWNEPKEWCEVEDLGQRPGPRIQHTMNFIPQLASLIVFGGKDERSEQVVIYYNDINICNLQNYNWMKVQQYGRYIEPRAGHCAYVEKKNFVIFGGINDKGYINSQVGILELDQSLAKNLSEQQMLQSKELPQLSKSESKNVKKSLASDGNIRNSCGNLQSEEKGLKLNLTNINSINSQNTSPTTKKANSLNLSNCFQDKIIDDEYSKLPHLSNPKLRSLIFSDNKFINTKL